MNTLDNFGEIIIKNFFDKGLDRFEELRNRKLKSFSALELSDKLDQFSIQQLETIEKLIFNVMQSATHDFLYFTQEESDLNNWFKILVNQENVAEHSDGLHGELFGEKGWLSKYSQYNNKIDQ